MIYQECVLPLTVSFLSYNCLSDHISDTWNPWQTLRMGVNEKDGKEEIEGKTKRKGRGEERE